MSQGWVKMRKDLRNDPKVIAIAASTKLHVDAVVGKLHAIWSWCNSHCNAGVTHHVTLDWFDHYLEHPGFALAMVFVGWLEQLENSIVFPNWEEHNWSDERRKSKGAARVRAFRERALQKALHGNAESVTVTPLPNLTKPKKNTPKVPVGEGFVQVWETYPKHQAKARAQAAWAKINPGPELVALMLRSIEVWKKSEAWTKDGGQFVPMLATWLNGRRWEDELSQPQSNAAPVSSPEESIRQTMELRRKREEEEKAGGFVKGLFNLPRE